MRTFRMSVAVLVAVFAATAVLAQGAAPPAAPKAPPKPKQQVLAESVVLTADVVLNDVARLEPGSRTGTAGLVLTAGGLLGDLVTLPPGFAFPANHCLQQSVVVRKGATIPTGTLIAAGSTLPAGVELPPKRVQLVPGIVEIPSDRAATAEEVTVAAQVFGLGQRKILETQAAAAEREAAMAAKLDTAVELLGKVDAAVSGLQTEVADLTGRVAKVEGGLSALQTDAAKADAAKKAAAEAAKKVTYYQQPQQQEQSCSGGSCGGFFRRRG